MYVLIGAIGNLLLCLSVDSCDVATRQHHLSAHYHRQLLHFKARLRTLHTYVVQHLPVINQLSLIQRLQNYTITERGHYYDIYLIQLLQINS
jgi:hypothetical protein